MERWTHGVDHGEDDLYDVLVGVLGEVLRHVPAVLQLAQWLEAQWLVVSSSAFSS
jgi:hypothetical protein